MFTTEQVLKSFAIACESPEKYGRPISHWTSRELAEVMVEKGIVESISKRHVGRLLAEATLKKAKIMRPCQFMMANVSYFGNWKNNF